MINYPGTYLATGTYFFQWLQTCPKYQNLDPAGYQGSGTLFVPTDEIRMVFIIQ
jgi:hypothetical protein